MNNPITTTFCICCGIAKPKSSFAPTSNVCLPCESLPVETVVTMTIATVEAQFNYMHNTTQGRKETKKAAKRVILEQTGKKCCSCHGIKPPADFAKCAPRTDGLQQDCKMCINTRNAFLKSGGMLKDWRDIRAALRAKNDTVTPSAGTM